MRNKWFRIFLYLSFAFAGLIQIPAQAKKLYPVEQEAFVESWKKGGQRIIEQSIPVTLTKQNFEFEKEVRAESGKRYLLSVVRNVAVDYKREHWKVVLNEIKSRKANNKDNCRDLLLFSPPCQTGGDFFSSKEQIAYFCPSFPYESTNMKIPLPEQVPIYATTTVRKILVDGFFVIISSQNVQFDETDNSKIKLFELNIELKNVAQNAK
jgi:hypothetical protein